MNRRIRLSIILNLVSIILFAFALESGLRSGVISEVTYARSTGTVIAALILSVGILGIIFSQIQKIVAFYMQILFCFTMLFLSVISFDTMVFYLALPSFLTAAIGIYLFSRNMELRVIRIAVPMISLGVMIILGNMVQFAYNRPDTGFVVASTQSVFVSLGQNIPIMEKYGLFIFTDHFDLIVSIQQYILFSILAALISENYFQIVRYLRSRKIGSGRVSMLSFGLVGALSCQCESYIAFLPAFSILLINYILFPSILASILLLTLTYYLVRYRYSRGKRVNLFGDPEKKNLGNFTKIMLVILLLFTPIYTTMVVYLSLLNDALFFFSTGMIMILDGYLIMIVFSKALSLPPLRSVHALMITVIATAVLFGWFYPDITKFAFNSPFYFALMNVSMFTGGFVLGYVYTALRVEWREILNEYISAGFGVFTLLVFYVMATYEVRIWPFFSLQSQILFSLVSWIIMLPVMWLTTQISLNRLSDRSVSHDDLHPRLLPGESTLVER